MDSRKAHVYCHMTSSGLGACGGGGWALVMKIDGTKVTFLQVIKALVMGVSYEAY